MEAGINQQGPDQQRLDQQQAEAEVINLYGRGQFGAASVLAQNLVKAWPGSILGWKALATLHSQQGFHADAIHALQQALVYAPTDANLYYNQGTELLALNRLDEAADALQRAISIAPDMVVAINNLGVVFNRLHRLEDAVACYQQVIQLQPGYAEAHNNLGESLNALGKFDQAIACYRQAMELNPGYSEAYNNLGYTYQEIGQYSLAAETYRQALNINPANEIAHNNLGIVLNQMGQHELAAESYRAALQINPDYYRAYLNLGDLLRDRHHYAEAIASYLKALEIAPDFHDAYSNLLFCVNYHPDLSSEEIYAYYQEYEQRFARSLYSEWQTHANDKDLRRRLKIGYVSPAFYNHACRYFLEPLLAHHDHSKVEVYAYAQITRADDVTARYQSYVDHWIPTRGMSDEALTERIRSDGIDILIDVTGHTGDNRLLVFARKPAPISLHWLDFGYTTGVSAIDYYLTDAPTLPEGAEAYFAEQPWRLPTPAYAYRPAPGMGQVSPLPALKRGHITFGTLTRAVRLNHKVIRTWSEILKAVPDAHLIINSGNFKSQEMQDRIADQFVAHGIARERLEIGANSPPWDVLRDIDIGLDCFPHNSGTTLFEHLYMGSPFITLANRPSVGRLGASILTGAGHPEWIAENEQEYIAKAVALAQDLSALAKLRSQLRTELQQSPLMDEEGFTRAVEQAYRQMWQQWCKPVYKPFSTA